MDRMELLNRLIKAGWDCAPAQIPAHVMQSAERGQPVPPYVNPDPKAKKGVQLKPGRGTSDSKREQRFAAMRERQEAAREQLLRERTLMRRDMRRRRRREALEHQVREQQRLVERATRTIQHLEGRLMKEGGQQRG
jgi:hypothetical protein